VAEPWMIIIAILHWSAPMDFSLPSVFHESTTKYQLTVLQPRRLANLVVLIVTLQLVHVVSDTLNSVFYNVF